LRAIGSYLIKVVEYTAKSLEYVTYITDSEVALAYVPHMAQCDSKVFFPDDPGQAPQFSDCPRQAETTRRAYHSVVKLCSKCAKAWDEQEEQLEVAAAACSR
jgi:hypothetical protein